MSAIFISGEPPTFMTKGEADWKARIAAARDYRLRHPRLEFRVASWTRFGQHFDLDNLCKPVIEVVAPDPLTVWATMNVAAEPGLVISDETPPTISPALLVEFDIRDPPTQSVRGLPHMEALVDHGVIPGDSGLGFTLAFDNPGAQIGNFGFDGPIKPLLDAFEPVLGTYHQGGMDFRIRELRVTRGNRPDEHGVVVGVWELPGSLERS